MKEIKNNPQTFNASMGKEVKEKVILKESKFVEVKEEIEDEKA